MIDRFLRMAALSTVLVAAASPAANIVIVNGDAAGEGFNDPTPVAPVGGNPGTTLGQQRLLAFQHAANIWGATLTSSQTIAIFARFDPLQCDATSAVLGSAGAAWYISNFAGAVPNTWYPIALAEKIANANLDPDPAQPYEIVANFNSSLGTTGCLEGGGWYLGLDGNAPANQSDLVSVLLHEFGHGLGFSASPTSGQTGRRAQNRPSVWENFVFDITANKNWLSMTNTERRLSATNTFNLVWTGGNSVGAVPTVLGFRTELAIAQPAVVQGVYEAQPASFGPALNSTGVTDNIVPVLDSGGASRTDGCEAYTAAFATLVNGKFALVDRGNCPFIQKAQVAQAAGAVGLIVVNNTSGLPGMGGTDPSITIPTVGITQELGTALREAYRTQGRDVVGSMRKSTTVRARVDPAGQRPRLYAPNPFEGGSSVSHWDVSLTPNVLMEPFLSADLTQSVVPPEDLSFPLLRDIGW